MHREEAPKLSPHLEKLLAEAIKKGPEHIMQKMHELGQADTQEKAAEQRLAETVEAAVPVAKEVARTERQALDLAAQEAGYNRKQRRKAWAVARKKKRKHAKHARQKARYS